MDIKHNPKPNTELGAFLTAAIANDQQYKPLVYGSPIGIIEVDFSEVKNYFQSLRAKGIAEIKKYLIENIDELDAAVDLARVVDVNHTALSFLGVSSKPEFIAQRKSVFSTEYPSALGRELLSLANNQTSFRTLTNVKIKGKRQKKILYQTSILPGYEDSLARAVVTITDISFMMSEDAFASENEEIHKLIYHQAYIGIARISRTGRFMMVNKRFCDIIGYTASELKSKVFFQLTHPDCEEDSIRNWDLLLSGERDNFSTEEIYVHKKGYQVNVNISVTLIRDKKGKPDSYLAVYEDITDKKRDEAELRQFSHAVNHSIDGIAVTDNKGFITFANKATYDLYEYGENELIGQHIDLLNTPGNNGQNKIAPSLKEKGSWHGEMWQTKKDGTQFLIELSTSVIQNSIGETLGLICIARDITEKKLAEEAFERNHNLLKAVFESTPDAIFVKDTDGKYLMMNSYGAKVFNITEEEIKGKDDYDLFPEKQALKIREIDKHIVKTQESISYEAYQKNEEGLERAFSTTKSPFYGHNGKVIGIIGIARDISEKKKAQEQLATSEELFRSITENAPIFIVKLNKEGKILYINHLVSGERTKEEIIGSNAFDFVEKKNRRHYQNKLSEVFEKGSVQLLEVKGPSISGVDGYYQVKIAPIKNRKKIDSAIVLIEDITEQKLAEEQLNESESRWRSIFEHAEDIIITINKENKVVAANRALGELSPKEIIGTPYINLIPKNQKEEVSNGITSVFETGRPFHFESSIHLKETEAFYSVMVAPVVTGTEVEMVNAIVRDITELKQSEEAIMSAMIEGQDNERKRIARELHDGLGQNLSAVKMSLASLEAQIKRSNVELKNDILIRMKDVINGAIQEVRNISHDLMPDLLEQFGIVSAMDELSEKSSGENIKITFEPIDMRGRLNSRAETGLYRITQELISNAVRHSMAQNVHIQLINHGDSVVLSVEDDGIGFDLKLRSKGIGLKNIESRVKLMNGELDIETTPGRGTLVTVEVPI